MKKTKQKPIKRVKKLKPTHVFFVSLWGEEDDKQPVGTGNFKSLEAAYEHARQISETEGVADVLVGEINGDKSVLAHTMRKYVEGTHCPHWTPPKCPHCDGKTGMDGNHDTDIHHKYN